jgi:hypothetical protein
MWRTKASITIIKTSGIHSPCIIKSKLGVPKAMIRGRAIPRPISDL